MSRCAPHLSNARPRPLFVLTALALLATVIQDPLKTKGTFPIAVWLQEPSLAKRYRTAGINFYVGLWQGPTEAQLKTLKEAGMPVVCEQNAVGLQHTADPTIVAWMHSDEPDNAQSVVDPKTGRQSWGPCVPPSKVVDTYKKLKSADPGRPVLLNLGQGVANDSWIGRGSGAKLDDYKTYVQACDIASFDVYPVAGLGRPDQLGLVAKGVDRLRGWTEGKKRVWNCLECTDIGGKGAPTPAQVKAEAWSAIVHGSRGLVYFVHQFEPKFNEHALLDSPAMLKAVTELNLQIQKFAARFDDQVVNSTGFDGGVESFATTRDGEVTVFAVSLQAHPVTATLRARGLVEEVEEGRPVDLHEERAEERFAPYQVRVYRVKPKVASLTAP